MSLQLHKVTLPWLECENCATYLLNKDIEKHQNDCPPKISADYSYVSHETLFGTLQIRANNQKEDAIKHVKDSSSLVFLSQSIIQLCRFAIGEWVEIQIEGADSTPPIAKIVWPTDKKALCDIILDKSVLDVCSLKPNTKATVSKISFSEDVSNAACVKISITNKPKFFKSTDLLSRLRRSLNGHLFCTGNKFTFTHYGNSLKIEIKSINISANEFESNFERLTLSNQFYRIDKDTKWEILNQSKTQNAVDAISSIGGLDREIEELRKLLSFTKTQNYGLTKPKSVLLHGHSGTGKTLLANALLAESSCTNKIRISLIDIHSGGEASPEQVIRNLFEKARHETPSIILVDDFELLCPNGRLSSRSTDAEKRITAAFLEMFDQIRLENLNIFVLAIAANLNAIEPLFRRFGRLDNELEIPIPSPRSREAILEKIAQKIRHRLTGDELKELAFKTHGYVGADLVALLTKSGQYASEGDAHEIGSDHVEAAFRTITPSAMKEVQVEVSAVKWSDIGGQATLKLSLKQAVEWPLKHPASFLRLGVTPPKGVLLYGPPGCSKTMVAKALATESGLNFLAIKGPELFSKWVGESERAVRDVFKKARQCSPAIIFFDEIDALGGERSVQNHSGGSNVQERVLTQLLTEMDGISPVGQVTILAATNRPDRIDKALLRPGRLDRIVYVPLPNVETRKEIFRLKLNTMGVQYDNENPDLNNVDLNRLVQLTDGYSGAEIIAVCHEAAIKALEMDIEADTVAQEHFTSALEMIKPRTPKYLLDLYENYSKFNQ